LTKKTIKNASEEKRGGGGIQFFYMRGCKIGRSEEGPPASLFEEAFGKEFSRGTFRGGSLVRLREKRSLSGDREKEGFSQGKGCAWGMQKWVHDGLSVSSGDF